MKNRFISSIKYRERKPFYGFIMSLLIAGLGQMYNGRLQKGVVFLFLKIIPPLLLPVLIHSTRSRSYLMTVFFILLFSVLISLLSAADAFTEAFRKRQIEYKSYNRSVFYILFISVYIFLIFTAGFVFLSVFDFHQVSGNSVVLSKGDIVLIKKYPSDYRQRGDLVLFNNRGEADTARIIALPGDNLRSDNDRITLNDSILEKGIFSENEINTMNLKSDVISEINNNYRYPVITQGKNINRENISVTPEKNIIILLKDDRRSEISFIKTDISAIKGRVEGTIWSGNIKRILRPTGISTD